MIVFLYMCVPSCASVSANICKPILLQNILCIHPIRSLADRSCDQLKIVSSRRPHPNCHDVEGSESRAYLQQINTHTLRLSRLSRCWEVRKKKGGQRDEKKNKKMTLLVLDMEIIQERRKEGKLGRILIFLIC